ncbi:hypothetical protein Lalb_Chr02g0152461 [Lupinus albus]|uniref:Uncharacterized protein n=1 Tax=Lupinus albus TaxID=3870 RepID=A0A6A4QWZ1_LUPAL|nr:hypothetical protein Lalb_Chr02g0152461 [Lupinus albus]
MLQKSSGGTPTNEGEPSTNASHVLTTTAYNKDEHSSGKEILEDDWFS